MEKATCDEDLEEKQKIGKGGRKEVNERKLE